MTDYSTLKGLRVRTLSTDTIASQVLGGSWSSGGSLNTARFQQSSAGASNDASLITGGYSTTDLLNTETYNGTSWTEVNDLNSGHRTAQGCGIQTAALVAGGYYGGFSSATESWNGSSWTTLPATLNSARYYNAMTGTSTSAIVIGGFLSPYVGITETYNGTSWTEVNDLNTARSSSSAVGNVSNALNAGGYAPAPVNLTAATESWNGSSWSTSTSMNTTRQEHGAIGTTHTDAIMFGGNNTPSTVTSNTEYWNGTSWTELNNLTTARDEMGDGGNSSSGIAAGGLESGAISTTEEWSAPAVFTQQTLGDIYYNSTANAFKTTKTVYGTGAWASGGSVNTARTTGAGAGTQTASIFIAGASPPLSPALTGLTETYDGSAWTSVNSMNSGRNGPGSANAGSQTSTLVFGGATPASSALTESWDGTNWTEVADLNTARDELSGFGTQTTAIAVGGQTPVGPPWGVANVESWNGSAWTEVNDLNTKRNQLAGVGISTAAIAVGGDLYPATPRLAALTESWDGTSWTEVNDLNSGRRRMNNAGFGTQTNAVTAGGYDDTIPGVVNTTESWNGTSWTEVADRATARDRSVGVGASGNVGISISGANPSNTISTATEEWNVPSSLSNQTITTS